MKIGFVGFSMVSSTLQIFRGQGAVRRQGKAKLVKRRKSKCKCRLVNVGFMLIVKGLKNFTPVLTEFRYITELPQLEELLHIS